MCAPDDAERPPPDGQGRPPRPSLRHFFANYRNTGLPWRRTLALGLANNWRKLRTRRNCCGNLGQPGC